MYKLDLLTQQKISFLAISLLTLLALFNIQNATVLANTEINKDIGTKVAFQDDDKNQGIPKTDLSLKEILKNHYEAIGGPKAWRKVSTIKFTGIMSTKNAKFRTAAVYKRPDFCRLDFQTGGLYFIESYDGKIPWQMSPGAGRAEPEILKGKRAKEMIDTCDFEGPLVDHIKKGHKIKYLGKEKLEDKTLYMLEITHKSGNVDTYYVDSETYLPTMVKRNTIIQDQEVKTTINVSDYIEIEDIKIPFYYEFIVEGNPESETMKIQTVELNPEVSDDIFKLPKRPSDLR